MTQRLMTAFLLTIIGLVASEAHAVPVTYAIEGNGIYGNPVGSFTYNASTNVFSNVDIWSLDHYTFATGNNSDSLLRATGAMGSVLRLVFDSPLTDSGGLLTFSGYEQGVLTLGVRIRRQGEVSSNLATAAPGAGVYEPGVTLLFVLGLLLVLVVPRRGLALRPH
jgi:hypothetical protein